MPGEVLELMPRASEDPQVQAAKILAGAIDRAVERFGPAADFIATGSHRLDAFCSFLRRRGPWILATVPLVAVSTGAVTPDAAKGLHNLLVALAAHP